MRMRFVFAMLMLLPVAAFGGDMFGAKEGLWEMTVTTGGSGMPGMNADAMARLTPDQRAMVEQMMKQKGISMNGNSITMKSVLPSRSMS